MGQYGHRNMYYMTGLPGWMRFGYSPGWVGRSPTGLGPAAQYLMTGQWPTPQMATQWSAMQGAPGAQWPTMPGAPMSPVDEVHYLHQQAKQLQSQLESIQKRIEELEKKE